MVRPTGDVVHLWGNKARNARARDRSAIQRARSQSTRQHTAHLAMNHNPGITGSVVQRHLVQRVRLERRFRPRITLAANAHT